ncbi:STAS domain-containing protein [Streptomyces sp. MMBL 11-3]|uniref:STAS domain-containing protein n=1 Tax=Streptomyces sp. MMBL 11-3 TaxID=3382639 RepID=UPI0039B5731C
MLTTTTHGHHTVITPHGDIDHDTLTDLLDALPPLPTTVTHLTWDFEQALFLDVAGLHLLIQQRHACRAAGRTLTITGLTRQPRHLLDLAQELFPTEHFDDFLPAPSTTAA